MNLISLALAGLAGAFMAVQGTLNGALSKVIGLLETNFIVHIIATAIITIMLFIFKMGKGSLSLITEAPKYTLLGGVINVFIIYLVASSMAKLGPSKATVAIIICQTIMSFIIDMFGFGSLGQRHFSWVYVLGMVLFFAGGFILLRK